MIKITYSHKKPLFFILLGTLALLLILTFATRKYVSIGNVYTDKDHVALYIITYHELPSNYYIKCDLDTKDYTANVLGGYIHSYQDNLPKSIRNCRLRECDIMYDGYSIISRGELRLVYTTNVKNVRVFYTNDNYATYKELSRFSINIVSYIFLILFFLVLIALTIHHVIKIKKQYGRLRNVVEWNFSRRF